MDKIFSARVDESTVAQIALLAQKLRTSKKAVIENAVELYAEKVRKQAKTDVFAASFGIWKRDETLEETMAKVKEPFHRSMTRHHR